MGNKYVNPVFEMDVFVRGKFLTSDNVHFIKRDVPDNIAQIWGYKKDAIQVIRYPRNLPTNWDIESRSLEGRVYVHPLTGQKKLIKGRDHGNGIIYKWGVSLAILCIRFTDFLGIILSK